MYRVEVLHRMQCIIAGTPASCSPSQSTYKMKEKTTGRFFM